MNVLCLGSEIVGPCVRAELITIFLAAPATTAGSVTPLDCKQHGQVEVAVSGGSRPAFLSRERFVHGGELQRMIDEDAVTGMASNPSNLQSATPRGASTTSR